MKPPHPCGLSPCHELFSSPQARDFFGLGHASAAKRFFVLLVHRRGRNAPLRGVDMLFPQHVHYESGTSLGIVVGHGSVWYVPRTQKGPLQIAGAASPHPTKGSDLVPNCFNSWFCTAKDHRESARLFNCRGDVVHGTAPKWCCSPMGSCCVLSLGACVATAAGVQQAQFSAGSRAPRYTEPRAPTTSAEPIQHRF